MYTYLQQALPRVVVLKYISQVILTDHRFIPSVFYDEFPDRFFLKSIYWVVKKKWKLRVRFSPTKENRVDQTKISTKTDKNSFSPAVFRSR